ncbi:hypothetical protein G5C66_21215 [Nocardioides sp. KC13]|uniref:Uncharacterized protein n=1 Tax=Nocardioides turkmenicus TaxID=2711220 RepID=A0A6M1QZ19_9ACTN|nr:hypothetical protein [Nocardioides sp. KC13]NGN95245.1 hypothetical protein [Nocardioides sp. KC13]
MRLPDDDELYEVDQTYLGPPRRYIGEMRYRTIFLFLVIAPVTLVLLRKLGMPVTLLSMGLWLIGASYLSMKASDYISAESSAGAWLMTFWHELTTPRVETGTQYAGGAAVAFRHATSPRGGWAKAMRRPGRRFSQQPGAAAPAPQMLQATVVASTPRTQTPPVRGKAAPVRRVIEAKVVEEPLPAQLTVQPAVQPARGQQAGGVRPAKGGWSSRPTSSPREPRDVPWKGGAPWQARQQGEQPAPPPPPTTPAASQPATPPPPPPPPPAQAPAAQPAAPTPAPEPAPKPARQPLSHAVKPAVVIAPEPGLDDLGDEDGFDEFDDAPSGRTRPRDNQDQQALPDARPQSVDDYRKRLDGDDAPNDGGTA